MIISSGEKLTKKVKYIIRSNGSDITNKYPLQSIVIRQEVNRIGEASLCIEQQSQSQCNIPESSDHDFKPGNCIAISLGYDSDAETVFEGIVVAQKIHIPSGVKSSPLLIVDCKNEAIKATITRRNKVYENKTGSEAVKQALSSCNLSVDMEDTKVTQTQLMQYDCTDWDFALSRAGVYGMLVTTNGSKVFIAPPKTSEPAALKVNYETDLLSFDGELYNEEPFAAIGNADWDSVTQKVISRFKGSFTFCGNAAAVPGCIIELAGIGERFNGDVFVGGVTHKVESGMWTTEAQMGISSINIACQPDIAAPAASRLYPGIEGLHIGIVTRLTDDPDKNNRIQVEIPALKVKPVWVRLAQFFASEEAGSFFVPSVGDEVVLGFINNDPNQAIILGSMYSSKLAPPYKLEKKNYKRGLITPQKLQVEFDDEKKVITIVTPDKNSIIISDDAKGITLKDQNKNEIVMNDSGIQIISGRDIVLKARGNISMETTTGKFTAKAAQNASVEGLNVNVTAKMGAKVTGNATAELSASGQTIVKGAMVMIN